MDFDLEIISEEDNNPDPLFDSIISAMNSMKEATADKIYQKIQREGATNYSKPQVDRALASALKYGIFEVKNNRYRVRDDVLDDVDTVYWKLQKRRDETPFRNQEGCNDKQLGQKLDPEKDNLRFKKIKDFNECPQCGRTKRPKIKSRSFSEGKRIKIRRMGDVESNLAKITDGKYYRGSFTKLDEGKYDSTDDSELDSLSFLSDDEKSFSSYIPNSRNKSRKKDKFWRFDLECDNMMPKENNSKKVRKGSSVFIKSGSDSDLSSLSDDPCETKKKNYYNNLLYSSRKMKINDKNQYFASNKLYERDETAEYGRKSDWIGYSDDQQGAIIQANNMLTIEPMDSMAFKGPGHTSYIS